MKPFFSLLLLLVCSLAAYATHYRGAELTARRTSASAFSYTFTLHIYEERHGVVAEVASLNLGNGQSISLNLDSTAIVDKQTAKRIFTGTYTFASAGIYRVGFTVDNRTRDVINMVNAVNTSLHIELELFINQITGPNNTPVFKQAPRLLASTGEIFTDDYSAIDTEGDRLVYKLVTPSQGTNLPVSGYRLPNTVRGGDQENTFTIDARTGLLTWNKPIVRGNYALAVQVEEWRQGVKISAISRDIAITVTGEDVLPPADDTPDGITTGISPDSERERAFTLYPNPASDKVFIRLPEAGREAVAEIWSTTGQMLHRKVTGH
jgi:hypothetical protein